MAGDITGIPGPTGPIAPAAFCAHAPRGSGALGGETRLTSGPTQGL